MMANRVASVSNSQQPFPHAGLSGLTLKVGESSKHYDSKQSFCSLLK